MFYCLKMFNYYFKAQIYITKLFYNFFENFAEANNYFENLFVVGIFKEKCTS